MNKFWEITIELLGLALLGFGYYYLNKRNFIKKTPSRVQKTLADLEMANQNPTCVELTHLIEQLRLRFYGNAQFPIENYELYLQKENVPEQINNLLLEILELHEFSEHFSIKFN